MTNFHVLSCEFASVGYLTNLPKIYPVKQFGVFDEMLSTSSTWLTSICSMCLANLYKFGNLTKNYAKFVTVTKSAKTAKSSTLPMLKLPNLAIARISGHK